MKFIKNNFLFILLLIIIFSTLIAFINIVPSTCAADLWSMQKDSGLEQVGHAYGGKDAKDIRVIIARIIKVFLGFLGIIFVLLFVIAGFKYMTSQGNEDKISEALAQIKTAIIGLIIIMVSYAIASYITDCVLDITFGSTIWMCK